MLNERLLRTAGAALIAMSMNGCGRSERQLPEPTPIIQPRELYQNPLLESSAFSTEGYHPNVLSETQQMWQEGTTPGMVQRIGLPNGNDIILAVQPPTSEVADDSTASTLFDIQALELEENHRYIVINAQGNIDPSAYIAWDDETAKKLQEIDIQHETLILLSQMYFVTESLNKFGFDLGESFQEQGIPYPPTEEFLQYFQESNRKSVAVSESIAELADFYVLKNIVDKNPDGSVPFVAFEAINSQGINIVELVPTIKGVPYHDGGLLYILSTTIASEIHQFGSFEELRSNYKNFTDIPGFERYFKEIETHFN